MSEIGVICVVIIKIFAANYCAKKAKTLNRNTAGWWVFGFITPLIAYFWINALAAKSNLITDEEPNRPFDQY